MARSVLGTDVGPSQAGRCFCQQRTPPAQEVIMSHQAHSAPAIAEQRQAELVAAAQYRLVRAAARGRGTT